MAVAVSMFGRDHWSVLAYIETRIVDYGGVLNAKHMRCNGRLHPAFVHTMFGSECPTRLKDNVELFDHDDWCCADDLEAAGLVVNVGSGVSRLYRLTKLGRAVCGDLRKHKASGGSYANFVARTA